MLVSRSLHFLFALQFMLPVFLAAQLPFMQYRHNFSAGGVLMADPDAMQAGGFLSYFPAPQIGFGVDYLRSESTDGAHTFAQISPYCMLTILPQTPYAPFAASLELTYAYTSLDSRPPDFAGALSRNDGLRGRLHLFSELQVAPAFSMIPSGSFIYVHTAATASDIYTGFAQHDRTANTSLLFGLTFALRPHRSVYLAAMPALSVYQKQATPRLGATLGFNASSPARVRSVAMYEGKMRRQPAPAARSAVRKVAANDARTTALPNVRRAIPNARRYSDAAILSLFRQRYPKLRNLPDDRLIATLEQQYRRHLQEKKQAPPTTVLPNVRAAIPSARRYSDAAILAMFRQRYPKLRDLPDDRLIATLEENYRGYLQKQR